MFPTFVRVASPKMIYFVDTYFPDKICEVTKLHPSVWSGVLSIAVGDSMAALVGRAWGRSRWPGTHRTLLGSLASFLSQVD